MTSLAPLAELARQAADSEVTHEVCCIDEQALNGRISMCGLSLPDGDLTGDDPSCVVCVGLIELWAYYVDTYGEDPQRPGDELCRLCPRRQWTLT